MAEAITEMAGICQPTQEGVVPSLADRAPEILRQYFTSFPNTFLTQHHMDSYESFIFRELPDIILSENPITILKEPLDAKEGIYKYKTEIFVGGTAEKAEELAIDVGAPIITLDNGRTVRRMLPNEARLRDLTYAATFQADILVRVTYTTPSVGAAAEWNSVTRDISFPRFPLFKIPILLRSRLCATHGASASLLYEMGECRNDQGGYFIIDGSEKVLITRQEQAFNSLYVAKKPKNDLKIQTYASVICQHPITKQTRRVALYRLHQTRNNDDGVIRISIPLVKGAIPLFALFRALGVESDEEIIRMILPDTTAALTKTMESTLISSIQDAWPITSTVHAIEFIRTLTKGFIVANVLDILHTHLFCHVPDRPLARAQYLAEIVRKMIRVEMGLEPSTNRDDIRNQRMLPTGTLIRGLFSESWKLWKKAVRLSVDKQYNYNKSLYQDENFLTIFGAGNISTILSPKELNDSLMRGFRGKWGTNEYNMKTGVIQPLARISYMDAMSHTRRVVSDFDTSTKLTGPRHLNPSQVGYFCTSETPTGGHIGATKNLSILTACSISTPFAPLMKWLLEKGGVIEISSAPSILAATATSVQINGGTIGFTERPDVLTRVLKLMKWTACIPPTTSVSFNTSDNILRVFVDDGRPLRPLWHLQSGHGIEKWPAVMRSTQDIPSWRDLVCGTLPLTAEKGITSADFVDPLEAEPNATLAEYEELLAPNVGAIEYVDPYEGNEAYISWWGSAKDLTPEHTHAEIHPSTLMGLLASMIPFSNHNQSPRNQLSCSQSKQGIGYYATNYENRFDTYGSMLCYGEGPLCRTMVYDAVGGGAMPYGANIIFCINSFNGYNQDDGILFNRSSIERGLFRSLALRSYTTVEEEDPITKAVYQIGNPRTVLSWSDLRPGNDYSQLDENGIIREGVAIHEKTVLVGRYLRDVVTGKISDASLTPTVFTQGRVDKVVVLHQANGMRLVRVRILEERVPELGDKFSSRHGQKGTMGMLLDAQDMPRTADGLVPDVMVNPHCIPSRMTIAQLLEQVFGKLGAVIGAKMNATPFMNDQQSFNAIAEALESIGIQREGEEIVYSGITGKMFSSSVFMGPLYFMRIKHLVQDKLNARPTGRKEIRTHQPTGGRGNEGGMRIGEMERDSLLAHGVSSFLQESMMKRSDGTSFWICNGCGTIPIYNESNRLFVCSLCDGPVSFQGSTSETMGLVLPVKKSRTTFSRVEMPYALKLLDQELTFYMNAGFRILTEQGARQFQEPNEWNVSDVLAIKEAAEAGESAQERIDALAAPVAEIPPSADIEEAAADAEDEGGPSHNDSVEGAVIPAGVVVIDFTNKIPQYKEFSTYHPVKLVLDGKTWPTVEHYFQAMKFPEHPEHQETIRVAKTPAQAKRLGKTTEVPMRADWNTYRDEVMYRAIKEKFSERHPTLRKKLMDTGNAFLREASPQDNYWGIGRKKLGQNKLGKILMRVRDEERGPSAVAADALLTTEAQAQAAAEEAVAAAQVPPTVNVTVVAPPAPATASSAAPASASAPPAAPASAPPAAPAPAPAPPAPAAANTSSNPPILEISEVNASDVFPNILGAPVNPVVPAVVPAVVAPIASVAAVAPIAQPEPEYKTVTVSAPLPK